MLLPLWPLVRERRRGAPFAPALALAGFLARTTTLLRLPAGPAEIAAGSRLVAIAPALCVAGSALACPTVPPPRPLTLNPGE